MAKDYITIKDLGMKVEYVRLDRVLEIITAVEKDLGSRPVEVWEIKRRIKALGGDKE